MSKLFSVVVKQSNTRILSFVSELSDGKVTDSFDEVNDSSMQYTYNKYFKKSHDSYIKSISLKVGETESHPMDFCDEYFATKYTTRIH